MKHPKWVLMLKTLKVGVCHQALLVFVFNFCFMLSMLFNATEGLWIK